MGLDMRHDAAEVTLNVCLGRDFEGATLRFCGRHGDADNRRSRLTYEHKVTQTPTPTRTRTRTLTLTLTLSLTLTLTLTLNLTLTLTLTLTLPR